jgi:hypothetical protein
MKKILILLINIIVYIKTKNAYDKLLEWGKNNSLFISDKLEMRYISENNRAYYAKDDIPENTLLMTIPFKLMLNLKNAFELLNSKKINKLYTEYKKNSTNISVGFFTANDDQTFLSYLVYLVNHRQKHYKKNKFYQYFQYMFDTFETSLDSYPLFYNDNQMKLLRGSVTYMDVTLMRELFEDEKMIFEKDYNQKEIDLDEYMRYRTLIIAKTYNISQLSVIPFIDMFENDPMDYNVDIGHNETNNNVNVFTTRKVRRGDTLYIRSGYISNYKRLILYGQTFDKMSDYIDSFNIPIISFQMRKNMRITNEDFDVSESIDLAQKKFFKKALKTYKKLSLLKKEDGSDLSAYKLFLRNLEMNRKDYGSVTTSDIYKEFVHLKDVNNVRRVLELETRIFDQKIKLLKRLVDNMSKRLSKDKKNNNNTDL